MEDVEVRLQLLVEQAEVHARGLAAPSVKALGLILILEPSFVAEPFALVASLEPVDVARCSLLVVVGLPAVNGQLVDGGRERY